MGTIRGYLLSICLVCGSFCFQSNAQELNASIIDIDQVKTLLGNPDQITSTSPNSETWQYGESMIFMRENKVVAWSDNGELGKLADAKKLHIDKNQKSSPETLNWINPWTPPQSDNKEESINEIVP